MLGIERVALNWEDKTNMLLRKVKRNYSLSTIDYTHLFSAGTCSAVLYGLRQFRKFGVP